MEKFDLYNKLFVIYYSVLFFYLAGIESSYLCISNNERNQLGEMCIEKCVNLTHRSRVFIYISILKIYNMYILLQAICILLFFESQNDVFIVVNCYSLYYFLFLKLYKLLIRSKFLIRQLLVFSVN